MEIIRYVARTLLVLATIPAGLSVALHAMKPWRETAVGKHLMAYMGALFIVFALTIISWSYRGQLWFSIFYLVAFAGIPVVTWWRFLLQWRAHRKDVADEKPAKEDA